MSRHIVNHVFKPLVQYVPRNLKGKNTNPLPIGNLAKLKISPEEMQIIRSTRKLARSNYMTMYCIPRIWLFSFIERLNSKPFRYPILHYSGSPIRLSIRAGKKGVHKSAVIRSHSSRRLRQAFIDVLEALHHNGHRCLPDEPVDVIVDTFNGGTKDISYETLFYDIQRSWLTCLNTYHSQKPPNIEALYHDCANVVTFGSDNIILYRK
ncbi:Schizosaccharomyces specific protein [Schizosaccharomyces osmophilus]|uniref:Schizosaccharomyces specific protein n=1 Tax=Schizosaccharomyces osmophilus TaxID=2545709 RepID=A0AAE9WEN5_9SCHI|nr:Schizosaccharomyces specific protein [Schizosaccharomyces osmophilus]WBW73358.1 Schizosaccharomyces specific protein [Schizosaccharomyces osmophilus]